MQGPSSWLIAVGLGILAPPTSAQLQPLEPSDEVIALDLFTVVVFPIEVLTTEPKGPELAQQMYDDLIVEVAAVEGLYVLGASSVASYLETDLSPIEIARQLGAATAVSGEISIENNMYYGHVRNQDARDGHGGGGSSMALGFLNPEHTHIKITQRDGTETKYFPDDLRAWLVSLVVDAVRERVYPQPRLTREEERVEHRDTFLDTTLSDRDRLDALASLVPSFGPRRNVGDEGLTVDREVIITAIQMAETSDNPAVRRSIWSHMGRAADAYVVAPLLYALQNDVDEDVRAEAATALKGFLDEPGVRDALDYASANDPSGAARSAAHSATLSDDEQIAEYVAVLFDENRAHRDRSVALARLNWNYRDENWLTPELTVAMLELARNAEDTRLRRSVWSRLSESTDPSLISPLLGALADDPSEEVRDEVVQALRRNHLNEPGVREALEAALSEEQAPLVRKRLEEALAAEAN